MFRASGEQRQFQRRSMHGVDALIDILGNSRVNGD
jgi:hypothetical protein